MTETEIMNDVRGIFQDIFDDDELVIDRNSSGHTIEEWDSLNNINLVVAIEKQFKIRFGLGEIDELKNVGDMLDLIQEKLSEGQ